MSLSRPVAARESDDRAAARRDGAKRPSTNPTGKENLRRPEAQGWGHYVGCHLDVASEGAWLEEGDDMFIDGESPVAPDPRHRAPRTTLRRPEPQPPETLDAPTLLSFRYQTPTTPASTAVLVTTSKTRSASRSRWSSIEIIENQQPSN